jgi:hypothetical protein
VSVEAVVERDSRVCEDVVMQAFRLCSAITIRSGYAPTSGPNCDGFIKILANEGPESQSRAFVSVKLLRFIQSCVCVMQQPHT